jgi:hypothetical protein
MATKFEWYGSDVCEEAITRVVTLAPGRAGWRPIGAVPQDTHGTSRPFGDAECGVEIGDEIGHAFEPDG